MVRLLLLLPLAAAVACGGQPLTPLDDFDSPDLEGNWEDLEDLGEQGKVIVPEKEIALKPQDKLLLVIRQGQAYQRTGQAIKNAPLNVPGFCDALALHEAIWQDARGGPMFSLLRRLWNEPDLCSHRRGWNALKHTFVSFSDINNRPQRHSVQTLLRDTVVPATRVVSNLRASLETAVVALWQPGHNLRPQKTSIMTSDIQDLMKGVEADSGVVGSRRKPQLGKWSENTINHLLHNCLSCDSSDQRILQDSFEQYFEHSISPLWSYPDGKLHIPSPGNYDEPSQQQLTQRFMNLDADQRNENLLTRFMSDLQHMPEQVVIASGHAHYWQQFMKQFQGGDSSCAQVATKLMDPGAVVAMRVHGDGSSKFDALADCYVVYGGLSDHASYLRPLPGPAVILNPNVMSGDVDISKPHISKPYDQIKFQKLEASEPDQIAHEATKQSSGVNLV